MTAFVAGGALPLEGAARVEREFEQRAFEELAKGRWVVIRGPRQHGKTTGLVWLRKTLIDAGISSARVTLQGLDPTISYPAFLNRLRESMAQQLEVELPEDAEPPASVEQALSNVLPDGESSLALLLDEVSGVLATEWRDQFFGDLRALSDQAADAPPESVASRVVCVFSGTFVTDDLISRDHPNSPFNTCVEIDTDDLSLKQAQAMAGSVEGADLGDLVEPAFDLVGGQPYLLQFLFDTAWEGADEDERRARFDRAAEELLAGRGQHLQHLFNRILSDDEMREAFGELVANPDSTAIAPTRAHERLIVTGAARRDGVNLRVRNRLYYDVARRHPLLQRDEGTTPSSTVPASVGQLGFMRNDQLQAIALSMSEGGLREQAEGRNRLAVVALGTALEAILVDFIGGLETTDLSNAVSAASTNFNKYEDPSDPVSWRLVNLVAVAAETGRLSSGGAKAFDAVRDWRNLIHPGLAIRDYLSDDDLAAEATATSGLLGILIRSLS